MTTSSGTTSETNTLTDRYVAAVLRSIGGRQRDDIERELRASIGDAIDDRLAAGENPRTAERDVLTELGDPIRLAAGYSGRPLYLIGPTLFADYQRLLTVLELIVVPIVVATLAVIGVLQGESPIDVAGGAVWTGISVAVHLAFWITLAFAIVERVPAARTKPLMGWTTDMLPELSSRRGRRTEFIIEVCFAAFFVTALLLVPYVSPVTDADGELIPFLDPWLWESGVVYLLIAVVVVQIVFAFFKAYGRRWSIPLAIGATLADIAAASIMIWAAATSHVLNPAFLAAVGWPENVEVIVNFVLIGLAVLTIVTTAFENFKAVRRA
jgi:hypothetical protein